MTTTGPVNQQHHLMVFLIYIDYDLMNQNPHNPLLQSHVTGWCIPNRGQVLSQAHQDFLIGHRRRSHSGIELAEATLDGIRKEHMEFLVTVPLLIIDDLGMRKLPLTAAEDLLEIIRRRYERTSTMLTSNRPVEDWGKLLGDAAAVSAMLDRLLHHGHVLKCGPRSWRTKTDLPPQEPPG